MSYWMIAATAGAVALVGALFAALIFRLDDAIEEELRLGEEEQRWTSII